MGNLLPMRINHYSIDHNDMTNYRRAKFCGGYYFFTVVTYKRRRFLVGDLSRTCLRNAWRSVRQNRPFEVVAFCLLPEHLHCVWRLPEGDNDFSQRWKLIKKGFTPRFEYRISNKECRM